MLKFSEDGKAYASALAELVLRHLMYAGFAPPAHSTYPSDAHAKEAVLKSLCNENAEKNIATILSIAHESLFHSHDAYITKGFGRESLEWQQKLEDSCKTVLDDVFSEDQLCEGRIKDSFGIKVFHDDVLSISMRLSNTYMSLRQEQLDRDNQELVDDINDIIAMQEGRNRHAYNLRERDPKRQRTV